MSTTEQQPNELQRYCEAVALRAKSASRQLALCDSDVKNRWLIASARALRQQCSAIVAANRLDLDAAPGFGLTEAQADRLRLDAGRIDGIAEGLAQVAGLPDPVGELIETTNRPNGLVLRKVRVPLGVVFFVYESRPNVTADAAAICVKSGNAVILRGGKEAAHSSRAIVNVMLEQAREVGLPVDSVQLVEPTDRAAVGEFLSLHKYIDLAIPRGGEGLIRRVAAEATMPVIKHYTGNCHVYVDKAAELPMAANIVVNSKCQRMGVCNAAESLLIHQDILDRFLPLIVSELEPFDIELRGDQRICAAVPAAKMATEEDFATEFLGPVLSVRVVPDVQTAIDHINRYGSGHTDAIVTNDREAAAKFTAGVDSSAVMVNASTRFNDGGEFGLGAEIGISTDKFHARGPCGLRELTSYKYIVMGSGQIRG
ncbi:MAG: glutamate-5-semialdehyde dehydrogenase [Pirellulaceae bacterium]